METNKSKQNEPAFPSLSQMNESGYISNENFGMSKRFFAACAAMQGMLSNGTENIYEKDLTVLRAYAYADEILKQENI